MKKRLINFRSFAFIAAVICLAIFFALLSLNSPIIGFILMIMLFGGLGSSLFFYKKMRKYVIVSVVVAFVLGLTATTIFLGFNSSWQSNIREQGNVEGYVKEISYSSGKHRIVLTDVLINEEKIPEKVCIFATGKIDSEFSVGDRVSLYAKLDFNKIIDGMTVNGHVFRSGIKYYAYSNAENLTITQGAPTFLDNIGNTVKELFINAMGGEYGGLAYGMILGDKTGISDQTRKDFSVSGIGHVLAVSGLHVGFLTLLIMWLLKKLKAGRLLTFTITAAVLIFYTVLAGCSPSIIRATIMCLIGLLCALFGEQSDPLSSLSFAVSAILTFAPMYLFEAGFLMSCSAVFGIIIFNRLISAALAKIKIPEKAATLIAVSVSAQLGVLPAMLFFFEQVSIFSTLVNVLLLPIIEVVFIITLIITFICAVLPFLSFLLTLCGFGFKLIVLITSFVSDLPFASVSVYSGMAVFAIYLIYFCFSRFFNIKYKVYMRVAAVAACIIIAFSSVIFDFRSEYVVKIGVNNYDSTIYHVEGKNFIIGDLPDSKNLSLYLRKHNVRKIDGIFLFKLTYELADNILEAYKDFGAFDIFIYDDGIAEGIMTLAYNDIFPILFDENTQMPLDAEFRGSDFIGFSGREDKILFARDGLDYSFIRGYKIISARMLFGEWAAENVLILSSSNGQVGEFLQLVANGDSVEYVL